MLKRGIKVERKKDKIAFIYPFNGLLLKIELKKLSSDIQVFNQIMLYREYQGLVDFIKKNNLPSINMIDAGANVGLTTLYFKAFFPKIKIFALEPSKETFLRLENNVRANKVLKVNLLNKGLWSHSTFLKADRSFRDGKDWAFRLVPAENKEMATFETISMADLIDQYQLETIDIVKMDIEGGEDEIFNENWPLDWLKRVRVIAIEIHDEFNCRKKIGRILVNYNFKLFQSGELTIGLNEDLPVNEKLIS